MSRYALSVSAISLMFLATACRSQTAQSEVTARNTAGSSGSDTAGAGDIRWIEQRVEGAPLISFRLVFRSGSSDDPAGQEGATAVLARAMTRGAAGGQSYEELTRRLFPMAASVEAQIDRDLTAFTATVHRDHVREFYAILQAILLRPELRQDDVTRVTAQVRSELTDDLRGNDDEQLGRELLQYALYRGHPYGHPTSGTVRGLSALTRESLQAHRARVFCRDRLTVGIAGGFEPQLIAQMRADLQALPERCPERAALPAVARPQGVHLLFAHKPSASATAISIGTHVSLDRAHQDFFAVQFVSNYLGLHRQSSGVLYQTLRESRGLNYGDYAYVEHFEQEGHSRFPTPHLLRRQQYASIWLRPVRPETAHFAIRGALRALSQTLRDGIEPAAFERTQTFLSGYVTLYAQTDSARLGSAVDASLLGWPASEGYATRAQQSWAALRANDAIEAARRHLSAQDLWITVVAPNAPELAQAIQSEATSVMRYDSPKPQSVLDEDREINAYRIGVAPNAVEVVPAAQLFAQ
ncbi:MAG: pitrilysin family protein [Deltaproteobacteria bacterium]|nr:pitrilysin family protein [Deltaproteobacteria bacterium]